MKNRFEKGQIRVPMRLQNGTWVAFPNGEPLKLRDGAIADLMVGINTIEDNVFLKNAKRKSFHRIFDVGTPLLVELSIREELDYGLEEHFVEYPNRSFSGRSTSWSYSANLTGAKFVAVEIVPYDYPCHLRGIPNDLGIYLELQGRIPHALRLQGGIRLPHDGTIVRSLNHALTKLSEAYETQRISHSGNVYTQMYYQELDGRWHPLESLRNPNLGLLQEQPHFAECWRGIEYALAND